MARGERPLLNPVLALRVGPTSRDAKGGGKGRAQIREERLRRQRARLAEQFRTIGREAVNARLYNGRVGLVVEMFDDALAPSSTPTDFFERNADAQFVSPRSGGYLVEVRRDRLANLSETALSDSTVASQVDLSNIASVRLLGETDVLRRPATELWNQAMEVDGGRLFRVTFMPFRDREARNQVMRHLDELSGERLLRPLALDGDGEASAADAPASRVDSTLSLGMRRYRNTARGAAAVIVDAPGKLVLLAGSGAVSRIGTPRPLAITQPGSGAEPTADPLPPSVATAPVVGVLDGGHGTRRYRAAVAWEATPFVEPAHADKPHGNQVVSLVVQGHAWNDGLVLPELECRVGIAAAIAKREHTHRYLSTVRFVEYVEALFKAHADTRVWNLSFTNSDST